MSKDILRLERFLERAALKSRGYDEKEMSLPIIALCGAGDVPPALLAAAAEGVTAAGGIVTTSILPEAKSPAAEGRGYDLVFREAAADISETILRRGGCDGALIIGGDILSLSGMVIGAARYNLPVVVITYHDNDDSGLKETYARLKKGETDLSELKKAELFTDDERLNDDNAYKLFLEAAGMCLPGMALYPNRLKLKLCRSSGAAAVRLSKESVNIKQILTENAVKNGLAVLSAAGGNAGAVLEAMALACELGFERGFDAVNAASCPAFFDCAPDESLKKLRDKGGLPLLFHYLNSLPLKQRLITPVEGVAGNIDIPFDDNGIAAENGAGLKVLKGNLAENGCLATGLKKNFCGRAVVFDSAAESDNAILAGGVTAGSVVVVRYQGARENGMPALDTGIYAQIASPDVAVITDGRLKASAGVRVSCIDAEAAAGGTLAVVNNGDEIEIDAKGKLTLKVSAKEINQRIKKLRPHLVPNTGTLDKFIHLVTSPAYGCTLKKKF